MANNSISNFIGGFQGGARPNLFAVTLGIGGPDTKGLEFHCKAASLPSSIISKMINWSGLSTHSFSNSL